MPDALTDADVEAAFRLGVSRHFLEHMDTGLGTAQVVPLLKAAGQSWGHVGPCGDGPYSDGENAEWWSIWLERIPAGVAVRVEHCVRDPESSTVLREGRVVWNQLANMATVTALRMRRERDPDAEPRPGEQTALPI